MMVDKTKSWEYLVVSAFFLIIGIYGLINKDYIGMVSLLLLLSFSFMYLYLTDKLNKIKYSYLLSTFRYLILLTSILMIIYLVFANKE